VNRREKNSISSRSNAAQGDFGEAISGTHFVIAKLRDEVLMNALMMNLMTTTLSLTFFTVLAQAQTSSELTCRSKAKEIAAQTYSSCVTEARNGQIDQIRKEYQKQLADLKAKYDKELKKVGGKPSLNPEANEAKAPTTPAAKIPVSAATGSTPKATKGIAKSLPTRKEVKNPAPAANDIPVERTNPADSALPSSDESASQNDAQGDLNIQLVPANRPQDKTAATSDEQVY